MARIITGNTIFFCPHLNSSDKRLLHNVETLKNISLLRKYAIINKYHLFSYVVMKYLGAPKKSVTEAEY